MQFADRESMLSKVFDQTISENPGGIKKILERSYSMGSENDGLRKSEPTLSVLGLFASRLAPYCESVTRDRINHSGCDSRLIGFVGNQARLIWMTHEATLEEDGRVLDPGKHTEAGALDATVYGVFANPAEN